MNFLHPVCFFLNNLIITGNHKINTDFMRVTATGTKATYPLSLIADMLLSQRKTLKMQQITYTYQHICKQFP